MEQDLRHAIQRNAVPHETKRRPPAISERGSKLTDNMKRYVLTGAPGAGKTAIIRQLELDGFNVVEEAATDIIGLWQAKGIAEPWTHPEFIDAIVGLQQTRERKGASLPDLVQFHDRSVVCTAALADYLRVPRPQNLVRNCGGLRRKMCFTEVFYC
jgi:predicted ATPase